MLGSPRSSCRYRSQARDQTALRLRLRDLAAARVRYGYRRLHVLLRREGWRVNHKRVYRLYREEGLGIRVKRRKKKRVGLPRVLPVPATQPLERWSLDFLTDALVDGRRFRVLTIVDNVSRVSPAIAVGISLTGERVVAVLERLRADGRGAAAHRRRQWPGVHLQGPGCLGLPERGAAGVLPARQAHGQCLCRESFNGHFRAECLDCHWFASLEEARQTIEAWRIDYNTERPHRALGQRTPAAWEAAREHRIGGGGLTFRVDQTGGQVTASNVSLHRQSAMLLMCSRNIGCRTPFPPCIE